jgi:hypothetical protein
MLTLAGAAGGWIALDRADHLYILGAMWRHADNLGGSSSLRL